MKKITEILLIFFLITACAQDVLIRNLPPALNGYLAYGGNNSHNFYFPIAVSDSITLKWETGTYGSYNNSSIVAYDKYVLVHDLAGRITCLDLNNGKEIGTTIYEGEINAAPVLYRGRMFFIVNNREEKYSTAYYFDLNDGKIISQSQIPGSFNSQILKNADGFIAISYQGVIYKFNLAGLVEWKYDTGVKVISNPALAGNKLIYASMTGELSCVDIQTRKKIYAVKTAVGFSGGITLADSSGFIGDENGKLFCFNISNGENNWTYDTGAEIKNQPVCNGENVIVSNLGGEMTSLDIRTGKLIWKTTLSGVAYATPLLFTNLVVQPNMDSYIYLLNSSNGAILKRIKTRGRMKLSPVYFNGMMILGYDKGNIGAFEVREVK